MKNKYFLLALFVTFLGQMLLSAQPISSRIFETDQAFPSNPNSPTNLPFVNTDFRIENGNLIDLSFHKGTFGQNGKKQRIHFLLDFNLNVLDSTIVWDDSASYKPTKIQVQALFENYLVQNWNKTETFRCNIEPINDSNVSFSVFTTKNNIEADSLIFRKSFFKRNRFLKPYIQGNQLILISSSGTVFIESYSISSGILVNQRIINGSNYNDLTDFSIPLFNNPQRFLQSDSLFYIEGKPDENKILILNRNTLHTERQAGIVFSLEGSLFIDSNVVTFRAKSYHVDSTGVEMLTSFQRQNGSKQLGLIKVDFNDSILFVKEYGSRLIDEEAIGHVHGDSITYLLGQTPINNGTQGNGFEFLIYRLKQTGYDSLIVTGSELFQHAQLLVNASGQVFITARYFDFQDSNKLKVILTKVDYAGLTSLNEQNNAPNKLFLFPNPTVDWLQSDEFELGMRYRIYSIEGKLIREDILDGNKLVEVSDLDNGTYLLYTEDGQRMKSSLFIKK